MLDQLEASARKAAPAAQHWAVRGVVEISEEITVRQGVAQAPSRTRDAGAMVTVIDRGGLGYAATADTSEAGLARAFSRARELAHAGAGRAVFDYGRLPAHLRSAGLPTRHADEPAGLPPTDVLMAAIAQDKSVPDTIRSRAVQIAGTLGIDTSKLLAETGQPGTNE